MIVGSYYYNMKLILNTLLISLLFCSGVYALDGKGKITGKVTDKVTSESLIGVIIMLDSGGIGTTTDIDGNFIIENISAGPHTITANYIGYNKIILRVVNVIENQSTTLNLSMDQSSQTLSEVTITADIKRENTGAVMLMQKRSPVVLDGISAESIKKSTDKNSGEVIRRVSGASLQEGRFVIIRGLNDRYNSAMLDGIPLSSSEPDRKAFSFDLFPASLLDNLFIVKTALPQFPGDFSGGILQLNTKSVPDQGFFAFTAGAGFNSISTFKSYNTYQGGKTDWMGLDDGTRALPGDFPSSDIVKKAKQSEKIEYSKQLPNDWAIQSKPSSPVLQTYQTSFGAVKRFKSNELGFTGALSYSAGRRTTNVERADYDFDGSKNYQYTDEQYRSNVLWGLLLNGGLKLGNKSVITLKNLVSVNSEDVTILREGVDLENLQDIKASALRFTSTKFINSAVSGEHQLSAENTKLEWYAAATLCDQSVPDLRRMLYYRNLPESGEVDDSYYAYVPFGTASPNYAGKFYSDLSEIVYNGGASFTMPLKFLSGKQLIKVGFSEQYKSREFEARVLGYVVTNPGLFNYNLLKKPIDSLFMPENMGTNGFRIDEITNPSDQYTASSNLHAGFLQFDNSVDNFKFIWGLRVENFIQKMNTFGYSNDTVNVRTNYVDLLPSANIIYALSEKSNIRLAGSKTVARPEFRELAPYGFYDFSTATTVVGNDSLLPTDIYNADLRIEHFLSNSEMVSFSVFYKQFYNPIEPIVESSGAGSRRISFQNAERAYVAGIEMEWRKNFTFLDGLLEWSQWENLTLFGNIALMQSEVDKSSDLSATENRPLQGQSPYVINTGLAYYSPASGFGANITFNKIGRRIFQVGNASYLSINEAPRNLLDFQVSKRIFTKGEIKFSISDIFNAQTVFYQDQNQNGRYAPDVDSGISNFVNGTTYSFSFSWRM